MKVYSAVFLFHRLQVPLYRIPSNSIEYLVDVFLRLVVVSDIVILIVVDYYFLSLELISNLLILESVHRQ